MKLLNFKFAKRKASVEQATPSRQERKRMAKEAKAHRLARKIQGRSIEPLMGSANAATSTNSRQSVRARLRREAFDELTRKFPGEQRKVRRAMAHNLARRRFRKEE